MGEITPSFENAIHKAVQSRIEEIQGEEIKAAQERIEKRIKGAVADIATTILSRFDMQIMGNRLVIAVDFEAFNKPK